MSDKEKFYLTEDALFALVSSIMVEMVRTGENEALLIESKTLSEEQQATVMKANTLLTLGTMLLFAIVESRNVEAARATVDIWTSPMMQDLTNIAFKEEIDVAHAMIDEDIDQIEREINGDLNSGSSESSTGSSDS
jgi:hypothetical protein